MIKFADFRSTLMQAAATGNLPDVAAIDNHVPVFAALRDAGLIAFTSVHSSRPIVLSRSTSQRGVLLAGIL